MSPVFCLIIAVLVVVAHGSRVRPEHRMVQTVAARAVSRHEGIGQNAAKNRMEKSLVFRDFHNLAVLSHVLFLCPQVA